MTLDASGERLVGTMVERLQRTVATRAAGHCVQVPHIPLELADACAKSLAKTMSPPDIVRVIQARPSSPWHATPSKVVEMRNTVEATGGRLLVFVPAGQLLAAEDSFGASTFEVVEVADAHSSLVADLLRQVAGTASESAAALPVIVDVARSLGVHDRRIAEYLGRVVDADRPAAIGLELDALGLIPDADLTLEEAGIERRLRRNHRAVDALVEPVPPAERIRRLSEEFGSGPGFETGLLAAVADGSLDPLAVTARLRERPDVDFSKWRVGVRAEVADLAILDLAGDFTPGADRRLSRAKGSIGVRYRCRPAPAEIEGLAELELQLLRVGDNNDDLIDSGFAAKKRGRQLPRSQSGTWRMKVDVAELDPGYYRFRLSARDATGLSVGDSLGPTFRVDTDIPPPIPAARSGSSIAAAYVGAVAAGAKTMGDPTLRWAQSPGTDPLSLQVSWPTLPNVWVIPFSGILTRAERYSLDDPASLGRYGIEFGGSDIDDALPGSDRVPDHYLRARERAFQAIATSQFVSDGDGPGPLVSLADLRAVSGAIEHHAAAWVEALASADPDAARILLSTDTLVVRDPGGGEVRLVGPTHPLRLFWRLRHFLGLVGEGDWDLRAAAAVDALMPSQIPFAVPGDHGLLRSAGPVGVDWNAYVRPNAPDIPATITRLSTWLGLKLLTPDITSPTDIARRVLRYVLAHPWVDGVVLNFIQPGAGELILKVLLDLQGNPLTASRRYVVRLFASDLYHAEVGEAIDEFMASPDASRRWRNDAADALLAASDDPLTPKFTYSKHRLDDLSTNPGAFPAHMTFLVDWFELNIQAVDLWSTGRSFFGGGLIVEPASEYRSDGPDGPPSWRTAVVASRESQDPFEQAYAAAAGTLSTLVGGRTGQTVAVGLSLDRVRRSVLEAVHGASEWVVTVDPVFGDEYLDSPSRAGEPPRYLVESSELLSARPTRRVLVSSKSRAEARALLRPALALYDLETGSATLDQLLDSLQVLGAGLSLHLVGGKSEAPEALGLALAAVWLRQQGVLRRAIVIPLDLHPELFGKIADAEAEAGDRLRTDLAIIRIEPDSRTLNVHLVEVKARFGIGVTPNDLTEHVKGQLENSHRMVKDRLFGANVRQVPGSAAGVMELRHLVGSLLRYLDRAVRYRLLDAAGASAARKFVQTLDGGYGLAFAQHALLFDLKSDGTSVFSDGGVEFVRLGRDDIRGMLEAPTEGIATPPPLAATELLRTVLGGESGLLDDPRRVEVIEEMPAGTDGPVQSTPIDGPDPTQLSLLGSAPTGRQFGIIGRLPGVDRKVALDLDGTNVVSVFGVQGSGKSYTLGTLVEAALLREPALNRLPNPLAAVVFHYSSDSSYAPEFASMAEENGDVNAIAALAKEYQAHASPLPEVRLLAPPALLADRRAEFPALDVHPLYLGADELRLDDWKLLMGLESGDQMYSKSMTALFRELRRDLSVEALAEGIKRSAMSPSQKRLAATRLDFARPYVTEAGRASDHLTPGRLLIVDLRDELIESDEALSLFMILLGSFGQATWEGRPFNKLIVFDEAHKYMGNPRLTARIVETVREMRHRGTTVVLASQNPPSVPREIIELSTVLIAHRFTSPQWLDHIRKANSDFADAGLKPSQLTSVGPGEAYVWSVGSPAFKRPQLVRMRPRLTRHGGATRRATD